MRARVGEHGSHEAVLRRQELERLGVSAGGGELGEADEVGEHDGALDHVGVRSHRRGHHAGTSRTVPLTMATSMTTSSPGSKLLRTLPRPEKRTVGRTPAGREIVIEPETVPTRTGPWAAETMRTLPLTERTCTAPDASSTPTDPETVEISASPVAPTVIRPLVFETRQSPSHASSSTDPETVRRSALRRRADADRAALRRHSDRPEAALQLDPAGPGPDDHVGVRRAPDHDR